MNQNDRDNFSIGVTNDFNILLDEFLENNEKESFETFLFAIKDDLKSSYESNQRLYGDD